MPVAVFNGLTFGLLCHKRALFVKRYYEIAAKQPPRALSMPRLRLVPGRTIPGARQS